MTTDSSSGDRGRSLRDDLLADLQQGPSRIPTPSAGPVPEPRSATATASTAETPTVELRITPRAWSPAHWRPLPQGGGFVVSVGPVRLSLERRQG